ALGDVYVAAFDAAAQSVWANRYGDKEAQLANAVAVNKNGVVLISGYFSSDLNFSATVDLMPPNELAFVAAFDGKTGAVLWAKALDLGGGAINALAVDPTDQGFLI